MDRGDGGALRRGARADPPLCSMPFERAIAWGPAPDGDPPDSGPSGPGPIFFTPGALREMTSYVMRDGAGSLGYFAGRRFRDADSKEPWVHVDAVIPVVKQSVRTPTPVLLDATIEQARAQARAAGREVVGWYHSAALSQPVLTRTDAAAHERHFAKSNSFMLMIAIARDERQAALFRPSFERASVPFYELLESDASPDNGTASPAVSWADYFTIGAVVDEEPERISGSQWHTSRQPPPVVDEAPITPTSEAPRSRDTQGPVPGARATPPPSRGTEPPRAHGSGFREPATGRAAPDSIRREAPQPAPEQPDAWLPNFAAGAPDEQVEAPPATAGARWAKPVREGRRRPSGVASPLPSSKSQPATIHRGTRRRRVSLKPLLIGGLATATVVAVVAVASRYTPALWSDRGEAAPTSLAVAADLAESEVLRYRSTARAFDDGRVTCVELGRVLVSVDEVWIAYSLERAAATEPLDAAGVERERRLERDVVQIERHFQVTECPRP